MNDPLKSPVYSN